MAAGSESEQIRMWKERTETPREEQFLSTKWEIPQIGARQMECSMTKTTLSLLICLPHPLFIPWTSIEQSLVWKVCAGLRSRHPRSSRRDIQKKKSPLVKLTHVYPDPYIFKSRTSQCFTAWPRESSGCLHVFGAHRSTEVFPWHQENDFVQSAASTRRENTTSFYLSSFLFSSTLAKVPRELKVL